MRYDGGAGNPLVADCRLALALYRVAPVLRDLGVSSMRFSGAYSYRMSRVGRLSLHAYGLAIDVHEMVVNAGRVAVERDFAPGLAYGCAGESPALNRVACQLKATGLFQELLTPDYNADHRNHFHLAIAPLGSPLPKPAKPAATKPALAKSPPTKREPAKAAAKQPEPAKAAAKQPETAEDRARAAGTREDRAQEEAAQAGQPAA